MKRRIVVPALLIAAVMLVPAAILLMLRNTGPAPADPPREPAATPLPDSAPGHLQPRVEIVEAEPPRRAIGSLSRPNGSPWCQGRPTVWLVGHDNTPETPWCQQPDGRWTQPGIARFDITDRLNAVDGPRHIDRHDCDTVDANRDGLEDIVCVVGANKGTGFGYNELYLTRSDGTLWKYEGEHGLHRHPTMRTRFIVSLQAVDGAPLLFVATRGAPREDGRTNAHRLYRQVLTAPANPDGTITPIFVDADPEGPWVLEYRVSFVITADMDQNGTDDLLVGDIDGSTHLFLQDSEGGWTGVNLGDLPDLDARWIHARVADLDRDGHQDLVVIGPARPYSSRSYLRIYAGTGDWPMGFDFSQPVYELQTSHDATDLAIMDVDGDGLEDIYLVQADQSRGHYCGPYAYLPGGGAPDRAPRGEPFVPPLDEAPDLLLHATPEPHGFDVYRMEHALPGCGSLVERWAERSLLLAHGDFGRSGNQVLLHWP